MERTACILCCLLIMAGATYTQQQNCNITWGEPIMISSPAGDSYSPRIALSGDSIVHITWQFDGEVKLPYRRSIDGGNTFELGREMLNDTVAYPYFAYWPFVLANRSNVFLFFIAGHSGLGEEPVRMLRSHDGGATWDNIREITSDLSGGVDYGTISGDTLLLMYLNTQVPERRIIISTDAGQSWNRIHYNVDYDARFAITQGVIHSTSGSGTIGQEAWELYYARSTDLGQTWGDSTQLSSSDGNLSDLSSIDAITRDNITEIWTAWRDTKYGISGFLGGSMLSRRKINNDGWQDEQRLTDETKGIVPWLSTTGHSRTIAWWQEEVPGESSQVVVRGGRSSLDSLCPAFNITPHKYIGAGPMSKVSSHAIHVVWEQFDEDGHFHIYYRKGEFDTTASQLAVVEKTISFDPTVVSTFRSGTLHLRNPGSESLYIGTVMSDDSSFTVSPENLSVGAGDSGTVRVTFIPQSEGLKQGKIVFYHDGATSPDYVPVSGQGISWKVLQGKWNLISTPLKLEPGFPLPLLYAWDSSYAQSESMAVGKGYWAKLSSPILYQGTAIMENTVNVKTGWNMIGTVALPITPGSIIADPVDNLASSFFGYTTGRYAAADTLKPGYGYWVKVKGDGKLVLQGTRKKE